MDFIFGATRLPSSLHCARDSSGSPIPRRDELHDQDLVVADLFLRGFGKVLASRPLESHNPAVILWRSQRRLHLLQAAHKIPKRHLISLKALARSGFRLRRFHLRDAARFLDLRFAGSGLSQKCCLEPPVSNLGSHFACFYTECTSDHLEEAFRWTLLKSINFHKKSESLKKFRAIRLLGARRSSKLYLLLNPLQFSEARV